VIQWYFLITICLITFAKERRSYNMNQSTIAAQCIDAALAIILEHEAELAQLDAVAGDGDHGAGMARGFRAAVAADRSGTAGQVIAKAGMAFSDAAGGASGALVGMYLMTLGSNLQGEVTTAAQVHTALVKAQDALMKLGKAQRGDKTMLDTLLPFSEAFGSASSSRGATIPAAWASALDASRAGMESTSQMVAARGRSAVLKERSLGTQDPGATSVYYVLRAVGEVLMAECR
jgi:dihydroxyacetone kinase phosphoprotein-dependent L subunit